MPDLTIHEAIRAGSIKVKFSGTNASPTEHRFWARVNITGPIHAVLESACWDWTGAKNAYGYGYLGVEGKHCLAHRFSWKLEHGSIREGMHVLHRCDRPSCVNPSHLFLGTDAENAADRNTKERQARGSWNGSAKLTKERVVAIRRDYPDLSIRELARREGVSPRAIHKIIQGKLWREV